MARVTLRDIAVSLGVSVSTVSLALRGSERISLPVREKVSRQAAELGYRRDLAGSLLRTTKPNIIGLTCDFGQELHVAYSREVTALAEGLGYLVMTEDIATGGGANALARIMQLRAQAVIIVDPSLIDTGAFGSVDIPMVAIGQTVPKKGADLVVSNNSTGMAQVVELVGECSCVHYLDGGASASAEHRRGAFLDAMTRSRAEVSVIPSGATVDAGWRSMRAVLAADRALPQALVCYNDQCAQGALTALWQERLSVPEDILVVGFDNSRIAASQAFELTSVDRRPHEVARLAVEMAVARARGDQSAPARLEVDTRVVRRRTA